MTVKELIAELQRFDDECCVSIETPYSEWNPERICFRTNGWDIFWHEVIISCEKLKNT